MVRYVPLLKIYFCGSILTKSLEIIHDDKLLKSIHQFHSTLSNRLAKEKFNYHEVIKYTFNIKTEIDLLKLSQPI